MKISKLLVLVFSLLFACSPNPNKSKKDPPQDPTKTRAEKDLAMRNRERVVKILRYLPSPLEAISFVSTRSSMFHDSLLHDRSMHSGYLSGSAKAINLGIYGADLSYVKFYRKHEFINTYLVTIKTLAQELGIPEHVTDNVYTDINRAIADKQKALRLLSKAYVASEEYLRLNDRNRTAALLVTGGWLEGMYIACELASINPDRELMQRIAEQKHTLTQLLDMLKSVEADRSINGLMPNLSLLNMKFEPIKFDYVLSDLSVDSTRYKQFWANHADWKLDKEKFEEIRIVVRELREYSIGLH